MNKPAHILGIAGSLRRGSYNRAALRAAAQLVPEGAAIAIFELDGVSSPICMGSKWAIRPTVFPILRRGSHGHNPERFKRKYSYQPRSTRCSHGLTCRD